MSQSTAPGAPGPVRAAEHSAGIATIEIMPHLVNRIGSAAPDRAAATGPAASGSPLRPPTSCFAVSDTPVAR